MKAEPLIWRVRVGQGQPAKLTAVWLSAILAGVVGFVFCHSIVIAVLGILVVAGSTSEFWWGARYRLDETGASVQNGPSLCKIAWSDVRRLIVNDAGVTLSPLANDGALSPFRGVFLRPGNLGEEGLIQAIREFGGENVRSLV